MYLLIDNYDSFTYNVYQYLCELTDHEVRVVRNDRIDVAEVEKLAPEGIIISPGPGRPEDAGVSVEIVRHFAGKVPILGICLGHQAIGYAFGAQIVQAKRIVHGKTDNITLDGQGLFRTLPSPSVFTRYHSLVIDPESVPDELEVTAWSSDGEIMGVRHRTYVLEGVQFHPESVASEYGRELLRSFLNYRREPLAHKALLSKILRKNDLTEQEARGFMRELTEGNLSTAQIAAYLIALNAKGIAPEEIAGCAAVLQEKRVPLVVSGPVLDTCGTGGDGLGSFNISSLAALVAAGCGAVVAKHGNRAVSSLSGSADFYRELGMSITLPPARTQALISETGFAFLFAPLYHGAMKHAGAVRRELGIKTIMNLLGPLVNPAGAQFQLVGVYEESLCPVMARAAALLGINRIMVVHGHDGLDEISVTGPTTIVTGGAEQETRSEVFDPGSIGIPTYPLEALKGGSAAENAKIAVDIMNGDGPQAVRAAVALNAGAALFVCGKAADLAEGYARALDALDTGRVKRKCDEVIRRSQQLAEAETTGERA